MIAMIVASITCLIALGTMFAFFSNMHKSADEHRSMQNNRTTEHNGLSKEHESILHGQDKLSGEHSRLPEEHKRLSEEHNNLKEQQAEIKNKLSFWESEKYKELGSRQCPSGCPTKKKKLPH